MDEETHGALPTIPERLSRPAAIARIRATLAALTVDENCACSVAARYGVLCRGFTKLPDKDFKSRFAWIANKRRDATREDLEKYVSAYHLGRQETRGRRSAAMLRRASTASATAGISPTTAASTSSISR